METLWNTSRLKILFSFTIEAAVIFFQWNIKIWKLFADISLNWNILWRNYFRDNSYWIIFIWCIKDFSLKEMSHFVTRTWRRFNFSFGSNWFCLLKIRPLYSRSISASVPSRVSLIGTFYLFLNWVQSTKKKWLLDVIEKGNLRLPGRREKIE